MQRNSHNKGWQIPYGAPISSCSASHGNRDSAGCVEQGEGPLEAAKRELYEETGYAGGEWSKLMTISPNAGACTNYSHTYLAIGVEKVSTQHLEASEDIKVLLLDRDEVWRMLQNDEFHQAMMAAPLWKYFALEKK